MTHWYQSHMSGTKDPQIMGSQDVLMAQLAGMEDVPGEFITKASISREVVSI